MKHIEVVAAIIVHDSQVLCVQRGSHKFSYISNKFEFPGGKIEPGETQHIAIKREIEEELRLPIEVGDHFLTVDHTYNDFQITMFSYICRAPYKEVILTEHIDYAWLPTSQLGQLDWAAADIPIVDKLRGYHFG